MKEKFNQQVTGVSPEQTRANLMPKNQEKNMVEQEQPVPTLKPSLGLGQAVDNQTHKQKLAKEQQWVQQYQVRITEIHTRLSLNGVLVKEDVKRHVEPINRQRQLTNNFNQEVAQEHDMKQLGLLPSW